ncbi:hypothetical protein DF110_28565 [Burkholderia stagnalis]|nr:hypothetical protein DF110_28565 [Burkholderia stagnalis]
MRLFRCPFLRRDIGHALSSGVRWSDQRYRLCQRSRLYRLSWRSQLYLIVLGVVYTRVPANRRGKMLKSLLRFLRGGESGIPLLEDCESAWKRTLIGPGC